MSTSEVPAGQPLPHPGDEAVSGTPQTGENTCRVCKGSGKNADGAPCENCGGTGKVIETVGDA